MTPQTRLESFEVEPALFLDEGDRDEPSEQDDFDRATEADDSAGGEDVGLC